MFTRVSLNRRLGFARLHCERLEARLLMSINDVEARANIGLDDYRLDPQYAGVRGEGYSVAIIDHGLNVSHPYIANRVAYTWNFTSNPPGPAVTTTGDSHGLHIASVAAGFQANVYEGVAPAANIIGLQVLDDNPNISLTDRYDEIEAALDWVLANAATYNIVAVNMSFSDSARLTQATPANVFADELEDLFDAGVIPIATTGNRYGQFHSQVGIGRPAADEHVLAVGATWDITADYTPYYQSFAAGTGTCFGTWWVRQFVATEDTVAPFTSRHPNLLDIMAPGVGVIGAAGLNSVAPKTGTSQAAPFVTGAVAIAQQLSMRERGVRLSFGEFQSLIKSTGATIHDNYYDPSHFSVNANNPCNNQMPVPSGYDYKRLDVNAMANQLVAPKVSAVKIGSSNGSVIHPDYTVPVGSGDQLKSVPVGSPNEIMITFTEAVDVVKADLSVVGAASGTTYNVGTSTFSYDTNSKTAKWTFASAFPPDQLVITLDDGVTDTAITANGLDGEWANPASLSATGSDTFPSGNGTAGGDFIFRITILPGDVTRDNVVDLNDLNTVNNNWLLTPATWIQGDQSGDNLVNQTDKNFVLNNFGRNYSSWPGGGMMMMSGGGGEGEIGEEAARQALLDYYFFRLANPKAEDPFTGLLGSSILGNEKWWDELLGTGWEQML